MLYFSEKFIQIFFVAVIFFHLIFLDTSQFLTIYLPFFVWFILFVMISEFKLKNDTCAQKIVHFMLLFPVMFSGKLGNAL